MKKLIAGALALALLLCACGLEPPAPSPEEPEIAAPAAAREAEPTPPPTPTPEPEPDPEPTPSPTPRPTELTLTGTESFREILALAEQTQLKYVDARACRDYEALTALQEALPDCRIEWLYEYQGETLDSLTVTELRPGTTEGLLEALRCLPRVRFVDLLDLKVSNAEKDALMAARPEADFLWWVSFGRWTVRSDIVAFSSLQSGAEGEARYNSEAYAPLFKYCRRLKALDLGHNNLQDLSLLGTLTELQVLILVDNEWVRDISPLANLTELRYLELFACPRITDMSPLRALTKLEDVNLCHQFMLTDPSIFDDMPNLKVCWLRGTGLTAEQKEAFLEAHPDAQVEFRVFKDRQSATDGGWRATDENVAVRTAFYNYRAVTSFDYWEDIEYDPEVEIVQLRPLMSP